MVALVRCAGRFRTRLISGGPLRGRKAYATLHL